MSTDIGPVMAANDAFLAAATRVKGLHDTLAKAAKAFSQTDTIKVDADQRVLRNAAGEEVVGLTSWPTADLLYEAVREMHEARRKMTALHGELDAKVRDQFKLKYPIPTPGHR